MRKSILASGASMLALSAAAEAREAIGYSYDVHGRLVQVARSDTWNNGTTTTYAYDRADNRVTKTIAASIATAPNVANLSFEAPEVGTDFVLNPTVTGLTFSARSGVAGNGSAWGFAPAPDGDQVAFVQTRDGNVGSIAQGVSGLNLGRSYKLRFLLARRPNYELNPITVSVNGVSLGTFTPPSTAFSRFEATFEAGGSNAAITFTGSPSSGDAGSGLDAVSVVPAETVANASFETPEVGNDFVINPTVAGVTFSPRTAVAGNGSAWAFEFAPDGDQVAAVQTRDGEVGSITQSVSGLTAGNSYKIRFLLARRPNYGLNPITVSVNGVSLGTFTPHSPAFSHFSTPAFVADGSNAAITFTGSQTSGDAGSALDAVSIMPPETVPNASFETPEVGSGFVSNPAVTEVGFESNSGVAGNGSAWGFAPAPDGDQVAFVQTRDGKIGSIIQNVSGLTAGSRYRLRFLLARRPNYELNPITVSVNGVSLGTFTPPSTAFSQFEATFVAGASNAAIAFTGSPTSGDAGSGLDSVSVVPAETVANASFETPEVGTGFAHNPRVTGVFFASNSGVAGNGSGWDFAPAPDGDQAAYVQSLQGNVGSITQSVSGLTAGSSYRVRFWLARRPGYELNPITVSVNGVSLGTFTPQSTAFSQFSTPAFVADGSDAAIVFTGSPASGDAGSALDAVSVGPP